MVHKPSSPSLPDGVDIPATPMPVRLESPAELPIADRRDEIVEAIRQHDVIVVCGETGSGKSTQLPKFCVDAGLGSERLIGHTQPRRLAAREVASRIAEETGTALGQYVGYQVRFGDQTSDSTRIKLMTDGILLAETQSDPTLRKYDAIIIDEAHERSLNIDFLMGYLRQIQQRRDDLKIIITSATIDAERFAKHFADRDDRPAPIINVEGRGYPVELVYLPADEINDDGRDLDIATHVIAGLDQLSRRGVGDTLVFLPTERDIREVSHRVAGHHTRLGLDGRVDLLPLYARLPHSQQRLIFQPNGKKRRIIFATNVAESSLTVPGIHAVIDTGTARISRYATRSRVQRLPIEPVSQASANQRAGRCGRVGPGVCMRLYSLEDFESRDAYTMPEIRRTNLASVVLTMKTLRLGAVDKFPFIDPPRPEAIREAYKTLFELSAVDENRDLTDIGGRLGRMPVDPRVGRMLIAADENGCLGEVLPIAASIEVPDPRDRPVDKRQAADEAHAAFSDPTSDFLSMLKLWRHYQTLRREVSRSKLDRTLKKQFLSPSRMREWNDVHRQLKDAIKTSRSNRRGLDKKTPPEPPIEPEDEISAERSALVHQSLLAGLLDGVAMIGDKKIYTGAGGLKLWLWPGSGLTKTMPKWIVAGELVETSKTFARTVAKIQPGWLERTAAHLIKKNHADPHWSDKSGGAFCFENQNLYGLPIVVRRRVPLSPLDPATARDLMIEHGLAEESMTTSADFVRHNRNLRAQLATMASKTRRRDLVVDQYAVMRFYQRTLPPDVCDRGRLEKFAKSLSRDSVPDGDSPYARAEDFMETPPEEICEENYPDQLTIGETKLPLDYRFEPGQKNDGINVRVHAAAVTQISDARLGWLVPGMLEEKIVAMIKSLPKRLRRNLVPAADVAKRIKDELMPIYGTVPFEPAVCERMSEHAEVPIIASDLQEEKLSDHYRMLVTVVDDDGNTIAEGRQIDPLARKIARQNSGANTSLDDADEADDWKRSDMRGFDIESLPASVKRVRGGVEVAQFPGLQIVDEKISTCLYPDRETAERSLADGATKLFAAKLAKDLRSQVRHLPALADARLKIAGMLGGSVEPALVQLLARLAMVEGERPLRSASEFERRISEKPRRIAEATVTLAIWLSALTEHGFAARKQIEQLKRGSSGHVIADIAEQTRYFIFDGWLDRVPWTWMQHYPRYHAAIAYRLDKLRSGAASRDDDSMRVVRDLWQRMLQSKSDETTREPAEVAAMEARWMIEELRVSLFAQPLGTSVKVSPVRIEKMLQAS